MSGPVAPKDPEKDRSYFYIMKEKETFGSLQTQGEYQGRRVQFIYESDGRLESSAEVTGEVCDEEILKKLGTVEGFKSLVHSIGISVEMEHSREPVTFVFQMYGKEDLYGGGTLIETELRGDGAEVRITLDTVKWKTDDDVPGQIRFVFETPEQSARVNVRFFLRMDFSYQSRRKSAWWIWNPTDIRNDRAVTPFYGRCGQDQKSRRKSAGWGAGNHSIYRRIHHAGSRGSSASHTVLRIPVLEGICRKIRKK